MLKKLAGIFKREHQDFESFQIEVSTYSSLECQVCPRAVFAEQWIFQNMSMETFEKTISRTGIPVVVDFWASWCGPCKMMAPVYQQAAARLEPRVRLAKVNTETEQMLASQFRIQSVPTLVIFKNGREVARQPGAMDLNNLLRWVQTYA